jgi:ABC-type phosphate/phosphonate transport system substrate-binding protein
MYDHPAVRGATDRFWQNILSHMGEDPFDLTREGDLWHQWLDPHLFLSQTCGYPYRARLHGKVSLVGTPDYGLPDCEPGEYNSVFVARIDDPRNSLEEFQGATFAYNEPMSQSGWAAPMYHARAKGVSFAHFARTGGHALSAQAVADKNADLAALDALSWKLMRAHDDFAAGLKAIDVTRPTPTLPYITSVSNDANRVYEAVKAAIEALDAKDRDALSLRGLVRIDPASYLAVPSPPPPPWL